MKTHRHAEISKQIIIDDRMESYRTFFDHAWARKIDTVAKGTALEGVVFDLSAAWRGAANTHVMPWLMAHNLKAFYNSVLEPKPTLGMELVNAFLARLFREMNGALSSDTLDELQAAAQRIAIDVGINRKRLVQGFDAEAAWEGFVKLPEFQMSLWGSQRLVYGAIYYAYEDFVVRSFKLATGRSRVRVHQKDFAKDFALEFGAAVHDDCWMHPQIRVARWTRHALVHNGGRLTDELKSIAHGFRIEDGEVQIMATHTKALFDLLKVRALALSENLSRRLSKTAVARK